VINIFTIGFTKTSASDFFSAIKKNNVKVVIDVRLNNVSQLSGFAKGKDLKYFLKEICDVDYVHDLDLAPTQNILKPYQNKEISWSEYADKFNELLVKRKIEKNIDLDKLNGACLLCSEKTPHMCHRRLVFEYLKNYAKLDASVFHL